MTGYQKLRISYWKTYYELHDWIKRYYIDAKHMTEKEAENQAWDEMAIFEYQLAKHIKNHEEK